MRLIFVSTSEVYGVEGQNEEQLSESAPFKPSNPYALSKAAADRLVQMFIQIYDINAVIVRPTNNYGPYQDLKTSIPIFITNALRGKPLSVYGAGEYRINWLSVWDTARAIDVLLHRGGKGKVYNIKGDKAVSIIDMARKILSPLNKSEKSIVFVDGRTTKKQQPPLDDSQIRQELGWGPIIGLEEGLKSAILWYQNNVTEGGKSELVRAESGEVNGNSDNLTPIIQLIAGLVTLFIPGVGTGFLRVFWHGWRRLATELAKANGIRGAPVIRDILALFSAVAKSKADGTTAWQISPDLAKSLPEDVRRSIEIHERAHQEAHRKGIISSELYALRQQKHEFYNLHLDNRLRPSKEEMAPKQGRMAWKRLISNTTIAISIILSAIGLLFFFTLLWPKISLYIPFFANIALIAKFFGLSWSVSMVFSLVISRRNKNMRKQREDKIMSVTEFIREASFSGFSMHYPNRDAAFFGQNGDGKGRFTQYFNEEIAKKEKGQIIFIGTSLIQHSGQKDKIRELIVKAKAAGCTLRFLIAYPSQAIIGLREEYEHRPRGSILKDIEDTLEILTKEIGISPDDIKFYQQAPFMFAVITPGYILINPYTLAFSGFGQPCFLYRNINKRDPPYSKYRENNYRAVWYNPKTLSLRDYMAKANDIFAKAQQYLEGIEGPAARARAILDDARILPQGMERKIEYRVLKDALEEVACNICRDQSDLARWAEVMNEQERKIFELVMARTFLLTPVSDNPNNDVAKQTIKDNSASTEDAEPKKAKPAWREFIFLRITMVSLIVLAVLLSVTLFKGMTSAAASSQISVLIANFIGVTGLIKLAYTIGSTITEEKESKLIDKTISILTKLDEESEPSGFRMHYSNRGRAFVPSKGDRSERFLQRVNAHIQESQENGKREIIIIGTSLMRPPNPDASPEENSEREKFWKALEGVLIRAREAGCTLKFLIAYPSYAVTGLREESENRRRGSIIEDIEKTIQYLTRGLPEALRISPDDIKFYKQAPSMFAVILPGCILINPYTLVGSGYQQPCFLYERTGEENSPYSKYCKNNYKVIWDDPRTLSLRDYIAKADEIFAKAQQCLEGKEGPAARARTILDARILPQGMERNIEYQTLRDALETVACDICNGQCSIDNWTEVMNEQERRIFGLVFVEVAADEKGRRVYRLKDASGSSFKIMPEHGCTVTSLNIAGRETLDYADGKGGIPGALFPFANRIRNSRFAFEGEHDLTELRGNDLATFDRENGHIIHGFARNDAWKVEETGVKKEGVYIKVSWLTSRHAAIEKHFGKQKITVTYILKAERLSIRTVIENYDQRPTIASFCFHPWFSTPQRGGWTMQIPAGRHWEAEKQIPTGRLQDVTGTAYDFREAVVLGDRTLDDVLTGLSVQGGRITSVLHNPKAGYAIEVEQNEAFGHIVVYIPEGKDTVCLEPSTSATDAFNLRQAGVADATPIILKPGEQFSASMSIRVKEDSEKGASARTRPGATEPTQKEYAAALTELNSELRRLGLGRGGIELYDALEVIKAAAASLRSSAEEAAAQLLESLASQNRIHAPPQELIDRCPALKSVLEKVFAFIYFEDGKIDAEHLHVILAPDILAENRKELTPTLIHETREAQIRINEPGIAPEEAHRRAALLDQVDAFGAVVRTETTQILAGAEGLLFWPGHKFEQGKPLATGLIKATRGAVEVRALLREAARRGWEISITGHLRGVDGCGSSLDLPEFQIRLTPPGAMPLDELPSTPTIASEFTVTVKFALADDENVIEYVAEDYGITPDKPYRKEKVELPLRQIDAPAYI
ncbi:NAD-dependent epimerase/dehydratase family protein, partial [bacterium]